MNFENKLIGIPVARITLAELLEKCPNISANHIKDPVVHNILSILIKDGDLLEMVDFITGAYIEIKDGYSKHLMTCKVAHFKP